MPPVQRSNQTREKTTRKTDYKPPSLLDAPPCPAGFRQRWIRVSIVGQDDARNVSLMRREGWEFVRAEEHPEHAPPVQDGKYAGVIGVGDLVLARNTEERVLAREEYLQELNSRQQAAVDNDILKAEHPHMPIVRNRRSVTTTGQRKVAFQEDE